jgi:hypothetical protein
VQFHPFEPLVLVDEKESAPAWEFPTENPFVDLLREGLQAFRAGNNNKSIESFAVALERVPWVSEARLGITVGLMRKQRFHEALKIHSFHLGTTEALTPGGEFDPVDQALTALILVCLKEPEKAAALLGFWPGVRHPALNAMRWVFAKRYPALAKTPVFLIERGDSSCNTETLHIVVSPTFENWESWITGFLKK